jgi:hypothetical protein
MNIEGVVNTDKTERYFWKVCGSAGIGVVMLVALYAFRVKIRNGLQRNRVENLIV